jgi:hypothetical protein
VVEKNGDIYALPTGSSSIFFQVGRRSGQYRQRQHHEEQQKKKSGNHAAQTSGIYLKRPVRQTGMTPSYRQKKKRLAIKLALYYIIILIIIKESPMTARTPESQSCHDQLIKQLADSLISRKFREVRADHPDFPEKPHRITEEHSPEGEVPDVTAIGIQQVLFEVETGDSINDPHIDGQWRLFAAHAEKTSAEFWVVVPKAKKFEAQERMMRLGLDAKVMGL